MHRRTSVRAAILLSAFLVTATPAAIAQSSHHAEVHNFFGTLWEALTSLFTTTTTACGERGSIMDPNGCPGVQAPGAHPDPGSILDPAG